MKKIRLIFSMLAVICLIAAACIQPPGDDTFDMTVVANVGGVDIHKFQFDAYMDSSMASSGLIYMEAGTEEYESIKTQLMEETLDTLIQLEVVRQLANNDENTMLTDEEKNMAQSYYDDIIKYYGEDLESSIKEYDAELSDEEVLAEAESMRNQYMAEYGVTKLEQFADVVTVNSRMSKYVQNVLKGAVMTEEEYKAWYDEKVKDQTEQFDGYPYYYEQAQQNGELVTYVPKGLSYVKHILIALPEDIQSQISSLKSESKDEEAKALREDALKDIEAKANEALKKVKAGDDFDALIQEYGEDPGMESILSTGGAGYLLYEGAGYVDEFLNSGLELKKAGDTTGLVATDYGYHIIMLTEKVKEGAVPYDDVKDAIESAALEEKQNAYLVGKVDEWMEQYEKDGKITRYMDRLASAAPEETPADTDAAQ